jgi:hypothetical protein
MRIEKIEQLKLGQLVKCFCVADFAWQPKRGYWLGIVWNIDDFGVVYIRYDDGDVCFYTDDKEVYDEHIYLLVGTT